MRTLTKFQKKGCGTLSIPKCSELIASESSWIDYKVPRKESYQSQRAIGNDQNNTRPIRLTLLLLWVVLKESEFECWGEFLLCEVT